MTVRVRGRMLAAEQQAVRPAVPFASGLIVRARVHHVLMATICVLTAYGCREEYRTLTLEAGLAIDLPDSLDISSGEILGDGSLAVISASAHAVLLVPQTVGARPQEVCRQQLKTPLAVGLVSDRIAILDSTGTIWTSAESREASCTRESIAISADETPFLAAKVDQGWLLLVSNADAEAWVVSVDSLGQLKARWRVNDGVQAAIAPRRAFLTGLGHSAALASIDWPFQWTELETGVSAPALRHPLDSLIASSSDSISEGWLGLRVVKLDEGYLQVLADKGSDQRAFVLFDSGGRARRISRVKAIVGVLDTDASNRRMLMLRRTDKLELVLYRWAWGDAQSSSSRSGS